MLVIHIGSPKTGTTALQSYLFNNEDALRSGGVNYMRAARTHIAHNPLPAQILKDAGAPLWRAIADEYAASPDSTHIISSEILFRIIVARKLDTLVPADLRRNTRVVCYLRPQDSYIEVLYKQLLKNNRVPADRKGFMQAIRPRLNYTQILDAYADIFGADNILVRPFVRDRLENRDIVSDFTSLIGAGKLENPAPEADNTNKTLSAELSEMLAGLGQNTEFNTREVIRELIAMDRPEIFRSGDVYTPSQKFALLQDLAAENTGLVERYLPEHRDLFLVDEDADPPVDVPDETTPEQRWSVAFSALMAAVDTIHKRNMELAAAPREADPPEGAGQAPSWYHEIYVGGPSAGFYHKFENYAASFVNRGSERLLVTFDNLHNAGNKQLDREPWAQKFCADQGWSHLGVYAQTPTWFRDNALISFMEDLRDRDFFRQFGAVAFAGTSMGGFAALTFSVLAPGATVVAFSPQSTLDTALVPWEHRFAKGRAADWTLPYSDAAEQTAAASKVYVVYDPFVVNDRKHFERLSGDNIVGLRAVGLGHKSALLLNRMGHLKMIMDGCIRETLDPMDFYRAIRDRKNIYLYRMNMEGFLKERGKESLIPRFSKAFKQRRRKTAAS